MSMTVGWVTCAGNEYICVECAGWSSDNSVYSEEIDYAIDSEDVGPVPDDIICRECGNVIIERHN